MFHQSFSPLWRKYIVLHQMFSHNLHKHYAMGYACSYFAYTQNTVTIQTLNSQTIRMDNKDIFLK